MDKYICKQCGKTFTYCRACVFKPISYKAAGFCSKDCSAEFKKPKPVVEEVIPTVQDLIPVVEDVEVVIMTDEDMTISEDE